MNEPVKREDWNGEMYSDEMLVEEFIGVITDKKTVIDFIKNMNDIGLNVKRYPEHWMNFYIKWLELHKKR